MEVCQQVNLQPLSAALRTRRETRRLSDGTGCIHIPLVQCTTDNVLITCVTIQLMHMLFSRCHGSSKWKGELEIPPFFAAFESCCVIELASHIQREWHATGV